MSDTNNAPPASQDPKDDKVAEIDTSEIIDKVVDEVSEKVVSKASDEAAKKAAEKASEDVTKSIVDKIVGGQVEPKTPWSKEKRTPKDYDEIYEVAKEDAKKETLAEIEAREKQREKQIEVQKARDAESVKKQNELWDEQLKSLTQAGHIPEVKKEIQEKLAKGEKLEGEDLEDPGIKARKELYTAAAENKETNLELAYYKYKAPKSTQPPGAAAPVFGSRKAVTPSGDQEEFSYEEIHNAKGFDELLGV